MEHLVHLTNAIRQWGVIGWNPLNSSQVEQFNEPKHLIFKIFIAHKICERLLPIFFRWNSARNLIYEKKVKNIWENRGYPRCLNCIKRLRILCENLAFFNLVFNFLTLFVRQPRILVLFRYLHLDACFFYPSPPAQEQHVVKLASFFAFILEIHLSLMSKSFLCTYIEKKKKNDNSHVVRTRYVHFRRLLRASFWSFSCLTEINLFVGSVPPRACMQRV